MATKRRVYCAGPMFSPADKWDQERIGEVLKEGYETFLPQRDGIEIKHVMERLNDPTMMATVMIFAPVLRYAVFALDLYMVMEWSDCVVFNMNGRMPDDGGIVEATAGFLTGKAVVLYKETPISFIGGEDNPMIDGLSYDWKNVGNVNDIPAQIEVMLEMGRNENSGWTRSLPPMVEKNTILGSKIWKVRQELDQGWVAEVPDLIDRIPDLIAGNTPITVEPGGKVRIDDLVLGTLANPSEELTGFVVDLWAEFCQGVREITDHVDDVVGGLTP